MSTTVVDLTPYSVDELRRQWALLLTRPSTPANRADLADIERELIRRSWSAPWEGR